MSEQEFGGPISDETRDRIVEVPSTYVDSVNILTSPTFVKLSFGEFDHVGSVHVRTNIVLPRDRAVELREMLKKLITDDV